MHSPINRVCTMCQILLLSDTNIIGQCLSRERDKLANDYETVRLRGTWVVQSLSVCLWLREPASPSATFPTSALSQSQKKKKVWQIVRVRNNESLGREESKKGIGQGRACWRTSRKAVPQKALGPATLSYVWAQELTV